MSQPRFLADNDLDDSIIDGLLRREPTIYFARLREIASPALPDADVLQLAADRGLIVVSHDVTTMIRQARTRLERNLPLPGLFVCAQSAPIGSVIDRILTIALASEAEEWVNHIEFLK